MKIVILDALSLAEAFDFSALEKMFEEVVIYKLTNSSEVDERIKDADVVLTNKVIISASNMDLAQKLKYIGILATGTNNVDLNAAAQRNIRVKNVTKYSTRSVSQHAFMSLLALLRKLPSYNDAARNWDRSPLFCIHKEPIEDVHNKKVALYGYGDLAKAFEKLLLAFDIEVLILERKNATVIREGRVDFKKGIRECDVLSIHCPLDSSNLELFNKEVFKEMRTGSYFINTARGPLVNSKDLVHALESGKLAGAAIDVLVSEPAKSDDQILNCKHPNLILTPHVAWASTEAISILWDKTLKQLADFIKEQS